MDLRLALRRTSKLVVASPEGDSVSVGFLSRSRHSRAGLWILPSLPGLVCGKDSLLEASRTGPFFDHSASPITHYSWSRNISSTRSLETVR
jgi:hypothetical protein